MLIKLDENLPGEIAFGLSQLGHGVHTTREQGLAGHPDSDIWTTCQQEKRFLITQDLDFSDLRGFAPGTDHGYSLFDYMTPAGGTLLSGSRQYSEWRE